MLAQSGWDGLLVEHDAPWPAAGHKPAAGNCSGRGAGQPIDLAPSSDSRMMSACPACWAVSVAMCSSVRRADQRSPGGFHGAGGSGWSASRSGRVATSSSVCPATSRVLSEHARQRLRRQQPEPSAQAA